ncbi:LamG domain-containing protein [Streptomyces sp. NPDC050145]|uniref:LamG domain-containing protein n=1 Tax=Streptomyces sp. NPDC050145 TaxID=3365602 RepID=UPI0037920EAA
MLHDPDGTSVSAEFEVSWTDDAGESQVRTLGPTTFKADGSPFSMPVPDDVPAFTEVSWRVRAFDGDLWGPWSSAGGQRPCEFEYDNEAPAPPVVSSEEYPDDDVWHDGVGRYGLFTADSESEDAVGYRYTFLGGTPRTVRPDVPGGPVTLNWLPETAGPKSVEVQAVDRAGNLSAPANYGFRVTSGRAPVASWKLADAAGSTEAAAESGGHAAASGEGVEFGAAGPDRTDVTGAVELDGTDGAYLSTGAPAVATDKAFSVSAWVRPDALTTDMAAAGQGDESSEAFRLGTHARADGTRVWSFGFGAPGARVLAEGGSPQVGEWAHLVGVYDPVARTARLYVNGREVATAEGATGAETAGQFSLGRALGTDGPTANWHGALADVRVWDRIVVADEAAAAARRATRSTGYWELDEVADGVSPERDGGAGLALGGDASLYRADSSCDPGLDPDCAPSEEPIAGTGHLLLDGDGDFAATGGPVVDTSGSFSVASYVKLDASAADRSATVFSLAGEHDALVSVGYSAQDARWEATVRDADGAGTTTTLTADAAVWPGTAQHVAFVYDAEADEMRLYVDGQLSARAPLRATWRATGGLQLGRTLTDGAWGGYLNGAVDEVHTFSGALTETQVAQLNGGATDI